MAIGGIERKGFAPIHSARSGDVLVWLAAMVAACALAGAGAKADDKYPTKPVRMMVSFAAGGPTDIVARVISAKMSDLMGNSSWWRTGPGRAATSAPSEIAKSPPDGYSLLMATVSTHAINPGLYKKIPYDPIRDFVPVGQVGVTPILLVVHPSIPATDVESLVALIKPNPGKYTYGSSGIGSILHLCGEQFKALAGGLDITHVPYRGSSQLMKDLISGQISMAFDATPSAGPQVAERCDPRARRRHGGAHAHPARAADAPGAGPQGLRVLHLERDPAPAGTPAPIIERLNAAMQKAMDDPAVIKRLPRSASIRRRAAGPGAADFIKAELAKWAPIIKASGAQVD